MKKIICFAAFVLIVLAACNKDKQFNKTLDGTWLTTNMDGVSVTMKDSPIQYTFSKSTKVGGTVNVTFFDNYSVDAEYSGSYKISDEGKTITIDAKGINASASKPDIHIVDAISDQTDKKYTAEGQLDIRRGFVFNYKYVFEKQ
jgi:hypothetical protein